MRGNAWQITAIIAIILVVVLIVPLVIMGRNHQTLSDERNQARDEQRTTAQRAATLEGEVRTLKTLISGADAATLDAIQRQHAAIVERALPGENDTTRPYHDVLTAMLGDLSNVRRERGEMQVRFDQLESDFNNTRLSHEAVVADVRQRLAAVERERDAEQRLFQQEKVNYDQQLRAAHEQQNLTLSRAERDRHMLTDRANQLEVSNRDISDTNRNLAAMLEDVRNPNVEHPAGRIISVDQQAGIATINVGSADGLLVRTMFSVYHSSITGLTFRTAPVGQEAIYCDVCRRDIARDVSKASVEVTRIIGPHRAEVRILDDILTDPIMVGDVIYSPIWKPGQRMRFALTAGMHLPGSGIAAGTEAVKRLIEMNGGVVDAWIEEIVPLGEEHLRGAISDLTNFVVICENASRNLEPEVAREQEALLANARNRAIRVISLQDLLSRMAWRNVTPVYVFGQQEFLPDMMRVVPPHQGATRQSGGVISPIFTPYNPATRVDAREASPIRTSPGIVSPLFNDAVPPPPNSSGRTSDLFRPRSPVAGQN